MPDDQQTTDKQTTDLLSDPRWLVNADPDEVLVQLDAATGPDALLAAMVYRTSVFWHRDESAAARRHVLALDAARYGDPAFAARIMAADVPGEPPAAWDVRWSVGTFSNSALRRMVANHGPGPLPLTLDDGLGLGRNLGLTGGWDGAVQVWNTTTEEPLSEPVSGHTASVLEVVEALLAGHPVLATADLDGVVRLWDLSTRRQIGEALTGPSVREATAWAVRGRNIAVTGDWDANLWDLTQGWDQGSPYLSFGTVSAASVGAHLLGFPDARIGGEDGKLRRWNVIPDGFMKPGESGHEGKVTAVAEDWEHIVTAGQDGTLRIRDRAREKLVGEPLRGHIGPVRVLQTMGLGDRRIAVSAGDDGTVRLWDLATGSAVGEPLTGHTGGVWAMALGKAESGPDVGPVFESTADHTRLMGLATAVVDGRPVVVAGGTHGPVSFGGHPAGAIRMWDLATGRPEGDPLARQESVAVTVASAVLDGRPVAVSAGGHPDAMLRLWDLDTGEQIGDPLGDPVENPRYHRGIGVLAVADADGRVLAVSSVYGDETGPHVYIWDLTTGRQIGERLEGHTDRITAAATAIVRGRPVAITGSCDHTIRLWDMLTAEPIGEPLTGHTAEITALATGLLADRPILVSAACDWTTRRWDLTDRTPRGAPLPGPNRSVLAVTTLEPVGRPVILADGDASLDILDLATGEQVGPELTFPTKGHVRAVAGTPDGGLVVLLDQEIVHLTRR